MNNVHEFKATATKHLIYPWFKAVADLVEEARMNITDKGINITCVDPANVAMLIANISPEHFETFKTTADAADPLILGIDFTRYTPIMKDKEFTGTELFLFEALPPKDILEPNPESETEDEGSNFNKQYIDSKYRHKLMFSVMNVNYKYETLDPESIRKKPKVPKIKSPIKMEVPISELNKAKRAMANAGLDHMTIDVEFWSESSNEPVLRMWNNSMDNEEVSIEIPTSELPSFKYTGPKRQNRIIGSLYSLDYLNDIIGCLKGFGGSGDVKIQLGQDFLITISMDFEDKSSISYLLAPRIESD